MQKVKKLLKSVRKNKKNSLQNKYYFSRIKTFTRKCLSYLTKYLIEFNKIFFNLMLNNLNFAFSALDKAKKKKILHKRTVARKKSKLQRKINSIL